MPECLEHYKIRLNYIRIDKKLFLNDKKYFLYGADNYTGNDRYHTDDKDKC
jgi:hypothetical protein